LMLTGKDTIDDIEQGLTEGADDYLTKPFNLRELGVRINALVRRNTKTYDKVLKVRDLELHVDARQVFRDGKEISLQPQELSLLEFLLRSPSVTFSVDSLLERVWPSDTDATADSVRVCITRLRNKIDLPGEKSLIKTIHRVGYKIDDSE